MVSKDNLVRLRIRRFRSLKRRGENTYMQLTSAYSNPSVHGILQKLRHRGMRWLLRRLMDEARSPHYPLSYLLFSAPRKLLGTVRNLRVKNSSDGALGFVACYSLADAVTSFDFAYFLAFADAEAKKAGFEDFHVALVRKSSLQNTQGDDEVRGEKNFEWRLANIVIPLVALYPSCTGYRLLSDRKSFEHVRRVSRIFPSEYAWDFYPPMDYGRVLSSLGSNHFEGFSAPENALAAVKEWLSLRQLVAPIITITIRYRKWKPERNSNLSEWQDFAELLTGFGWAVVFVPETDYISLPGTLGEVEYVEASWNLGLRLALYETAQLNFAVDGGPAALMHLDRRVAFLQTFPRIGLPINEGVRHLPFGKTDQMLNWGRDDLQNLVNGLQEWEIKNGKFGTRGLVPDDNQG